MRAELCALSGAPGELQLFTNHVNYAIVEEWMLEGKFNGYLTESNAHSFEKKITSGITVFEVH